FLETALADGADMIATGHYARSVSGQLLTGVDGNKDQSYFLYRVREEALQKSLMPIGEYEKPAVRELARRFGLATAEKKDSQGICFVGKVGIKEFLQQFVRPGTPGTGPGAIVDSAGRRIGQHDGALFYTIGQRQGLGVGGGLPYYVIDKDMEKNEVYVTTDLQDSKLWTRSLTITSLHWINTTPTDGAAYSVRTRYRAPLVPCTAHQDGDNWRIDMDEEVRALTPGQSAVLYERVIAENDNHASSYRVVGGGVVI
ncbi:MAG TPA: tRNA methyl transferase PRC-barrel domain-containing protein, partial [Candidatus Saccharimonadales bacterium]|nr:tRNA methyl transferase PRC-barrel domain-containing protein [Candidatus Saccharimonadales bacterium]